MGGTFMSLPLDYRDYFVRNLHDALSGHSSSNVAEAVRFSEQSRTRCIGLTIETRPDYCLTPHLTQVRASLSSADCSAVCGMHARVPTASCLCRVKCQFDDHEAIVQLFSLIIPACAPSPKCRALLFVQTMAD